MEVKHKDEEIISYTWDNLSQEQRCCWLWDAQIYNYKWRHSDWIELPDEIQLKLKKRFPPQ